MKKRIIGIDLLRILSMFGIIGLHFINQGGVIDNLNVFSLKYIPVLLFLTILYTSVNVFGLLSGYLNIEKRTINYSRILDLLLCVLFWCFTITFVFYIFNIVGFRNKGILEVFKGLFPFLCGNYWYITCYVFLFFIMQYINLFLINLSREKYKKLLIILFFFFCIIQNVLLYTDLFKINFGYSPFWLIYLYMIGGYIKLYNPFITTRKKIIILVFSLICSLCFNYLLKIISFKLIGDYIKPNWFIDYISPFTLVSSIILLLLFININIKNMKIYNIISYFSGFSFSVYIIHCHRIIYYNIITNLFAPIVKYNFIIIITIIIISIIGTYIICVLLDLIRKVLFKLFHVHKIIDFFGFKINIYLS
ncbi:acyltransferase family protein [Kandleria vitulina]|uniref:acyltransferase family protein n=1 Tax=Kandleria vitulina TaxID=1630 RepID=UPI00138E45A9|nr:acyltransferase family protein [Kandleria vitulina]